MPLSAGTRIAFTYPSGAQTLHANFHADETGFYFASNGMVFAFSPSGARESSRDVTLTNHPGSQTVWGFTKTTDDRWATFTRDTGTGYIGTLRTFSLTGAAIHVARVPDVITGVNQVATAFRAPKALAEVGGNFYLRVVRAVSGNMRLIKFDGNLQVQDDDLLVSGSSPSALSDLASSGYQNIFIIQQNERRAYAVRASNLQLVPALQTDLDSRNTAPWAASADGGTLYVADRGGFIYPYTGVPVAGASRGPGYGIGLSIIQMFFTNELLGREFERRF